MTPINHLCMSHQPNDTKYKFCCQYAPLKWILKKLQGSPKGTRGGDACPRGGVTCRGGCGYKGRGAGPRGGVRVQVGVSTTKHIQEEGMTGPMFNQPCTNFSSIQNVKPNIRDHFTWIHEWWCWYPRVPYILLIYTQISLMNVMWCIINSSLLASAIFFIVHHLRFLHYCTIMY